MKTRSIQTPLAVLLAIALAVAIPALANPGAGPTGAACSPGKNPERFPNIEFAQLKKLAGTRGVTVLDVNSRDSFNEAHVDGAIHFYSSSRDLLRQLPKDKSALIVAYCGGPKCTAWWKAAQAVCELGYTNVKHYKDGIEGWKAQKAL